MQDLFSSDKESLQGGRGYRYYVTETHTI